MDPSIVKLLEDDEDETMHSVADVEAFQTALNRDIGGDMSTSQPSGSDTALPQGSSNTFSQSLPQWSTSSHDNKTDPQTQQHPKISQQQQQQSSSKMEIKHSGQLQNVASQDVNHPPLPQKQSQDEGHQGQTVQGSLQNPQTTGIPNPGKDPVLNNEPVKTHNPSNESQYIKLQQVSNQQATVTEQPSSQMNRSKKVPFGLLLPILIPQLPKDRAMQLRTLYAKLKKVEISKDNFLMLMKRIVNGQMLRMALAKVQSQIERGNGNHGTSRDEFSRGLPAIITVPPTTSLLHSNSASPSMIVQSELSVLSSSPTPSNPSGIIARGPLKKPSPGQKKPFDGPSSSRPPPCKKQKVSGASLEESIEQLNDVTAVSGVDLREEEEQLFSGPKEDGRISEASRRVVQEEERLILQKEPLQSKLADIVVKCGLKGMSNDVEKCLSLCVEERMRGLISNLIRLSKQRVDFEKTRHPFVVTSDVRKQIMTINKKAREEWEKKQAEAEKIRKLNEAESNPGVDGDKEKDESRNESTKVNKEEDGKMRTNAANAAARAAVGGDDMLSKWQLMVEQARQKREGKVDGSSGSQPKDASLKSPSSSGRSTQDNPDGEKRVSAAFATSGTSGNLGRNQAIAPQTRVVRTISVKDVISALEREPQMCKSPLIYNLYERIHSDSLAE